MECYIKGIQKQVHKREGYMERKSFTVTGMRCAGCASNLEKRAGKLPGVISAKVDLAENTLLVEYSGEDIAGKDLSANVLECISSLGSSGSEIKTEHEEMQTLQKENSSSSCSLLQFIISCLFSLFLFYSAMCKSFSLPYFEVSAAANAFIQCLLLLPVLYCGRAFYIFGFRTLLRFVPNMDSLIALCTSSAVIYSFYLLFTGSPGKLYFDSAAMILTFIMLGKFLEERCKGKASKAVRELMKLTPETAHIVKKDGKEYVVKVTELVKGDIVKVRPGERVPADGKILSGSTLVDESMLTGESIPVEKGENSSVTGGTVNKTGVFLLTVEKTGKDTVVAGIIRMMQNARNSRPPIARPADIVSGYFVWGVILIACITFSVWYFAVGTPFARALEFTLAVLVIACPCALGLAPPIALITAVGRGAKMGILFKSGEVFEKAAGINYAVFDKTGTLTQGVPSFSAMEIREDSGYTENELLSFAASAEKNSEHSIGKAIVHEADTRELPLYGTEQFKALPGYGLKCTVQGHSLLMGNAALMKENNIDINGFDPVCSNTLVYVALNNRCSALIHITDPVKENASEAIETLEKMKIKTCMLTGDHYASAKETAEKLSITDFHADLLPEDKLSVLQKMQAEGRKVVMTGDGINDAPSLALADVGIAISSGTDVAIESADIVLMRNDLRGVPAALALSNATMRIIKENLFWAFIYNIVCIPLAAGVFYPLFGWSLNPAFASLAMAFSSVSVVSNALRLRKFQAK